MAQAPRATAPASNGMPAMAAHTGPVTALQFADRILAKAGAAPGEASVDRIVAGDPLTAVTGITTTAMATLDCLRASADAGRNLVVSYEPSFWSTGDRIDRLEGDPLFKLKRDLVRERGLVILTLHDRWAAGLATGMARALKWEGYREPGTELFAMPATTLLGLAQQLHATLADRTMRIVGDPRLPVSRVAGSWGNAAQLPTIKLLNGPADVVVCGYAREWEAVEYAQDMIASGSRKGLILLGEVKSVEGGMAYCAEWLRGFIDEVPIGFVATPEPYWNPRHPPALSSILPRQGEVAARQG